MISPRELTGFFEPTQLESVPGYADSCAIFDRNRHHYCVIILLACAIYFFARHQQKVWRSDGHSDIETQYTSAD